MKTVQNLINMAIRLGLNTFNADICIYNADTYFNANIDISI